MSEKVHQVRVFFQSHDGNQMSIAVKSVATNDPDGGLEVAQKLRAEIAAMLTSAMNAQLVSVVGDRGTPMGMSMLEALNGVGINGFNVGIVSMPLRSSEILQPSKPKITLIKA